jgi:hypothetical protein
MYGRRRRRGADRACRRRVCGCVCDPTSLTRMFAGQDRFSHVWEPSPCRLAVRRVERNWRYKPRRRVSCRTDNLASRCCGKGCRRSAWRCKSDACLIQYRKRAPPRGKPLARLCSHCRAACARRFDAFCRVANRPLKNGSRSRLTVLAHGNFNWKCQLFPCLSGFVVLCKSLAGFTAGATDAIGQRGK